MQIILKEEEAHLGKLVLYSHYNVMYWQWLSKLFAIDQWLHLRQQQVNKIKFIADLYIETEPTKQDTNFTNEFLNTNKFKKVEIFVVINIEKKVEQGV